MISILSLLLFIKFLFHTMISMTMGQVIKLAFLDGFNMIRCTEKHLQIHQSRDGWGVFLHHDIKCPNKNQILDFEHLGLLWERLTLFCTSSGTEIREEQMVSRKYGYQISVVLGNIEGHLSRSKDVYPFHVEIKQDHKLAVIRSDEQPLDHSYFRENGRVRIIYMQFVNHPIICRIVIVGKDDELCIDGKSRKIDDAEYTCYTDPMMDGPPSAAQLEAELEQIDIYELLQDQEAYVLEIDRPKFSVDDWSNSKDSIVKPNPPDSKNTSTFRLRPKNTLPKSSTNKKKESSVFNTVALVIGILLLVALIGGIIFYVVQKKPANPPASVQSLTSVDIKKDKTKGSSQPPMPNESEQSSINDDDNVQIPIDERSYKEKPNIASHKTAPKTKAQRGGTNMVFNDDG